MNAFNRFSAALGIALVSVQAHAVQPVTFDFTSATISGNTATDAATGLKITASAWSSSAATGSFASTALSGTANGFDIGSDMILLSFNAPVGMRALTIGQPAATTSSLGMWAGTGPLAANTLPANLGTATPLAINTKKNSDIVELKISKDFKAEYDWIAVSAQLGAINDLAKLRALTVQINPQTQPVPDAATWMTMLAGLGLVGFRVSRRTQT